MKLMRTAAVVAAVIAATAVTGPARAGEAADGIAETTRAFEAAFNGGDGAGVAALYTEDGSILPPGAAEVVGREGIAEFWSGAIEAGLTDLDLETTELTAMGDTAIEVGVLTLSVPGEGSDPATEIGGKFLVVWQRGADGTWRLHRDIWNLGR